MSLVLLDKSDGIATITLNRPEAMNALSHAMRGEIYDACQDIRQDRDIRAAIITGAGDRAFTAGLDLKELGQHGLGAATDQNPVRNPCRAIEEIEVPVIGAINGVAITGGFELAMSCDIRIASSRARFADTHASIGIIPGWGLSQKLSRTIGLSRACELSFTGQFLDAETACLWGLVNRVYAPEDLLPEAQALAEDMTTIDGKFLRAYKKLIFDGFGRNLQDALALEKQTTDAWNDNVSAQEVEDRRKAVIARGRQLKD
ncbi:short chain enoyl-CoA hydratase [Parasphingorhabdus marina DSM 22363]|uniref:Short chain enoyl-CoA hydratase n=1 Tax=Parasphingorhabdus marina DSM 22363 TaxID=1123272 RepID=A0A1N6ENT2_9SPHN|nr:enoyl-CoA hydratase [Parasphingorhabdus marina]SIN84627.1 short chain enoyl-CoA hydratase [Parasphingorhabdus marina DSM 22363]